MALRFAQSLELANASTGRAPIRILLLRDGDVGWADNDPPYILDAASAKAIIDAFNKQGVEIPIDYHHASRAAETHKADRAPAAGWIRGLEYQEGKGLYAVNIEWTDAGRADVETKRYKYVSPSVIVLKEDGTMLEIHSVALTNRPRTKHMTELLLAAERRLDNEGKTNMPKKKATKLVGLLKLGSDYVAAQEGDAPEVSADAEAINALVAFLRGQGVEVGEDAPLADILADALAMLQAGTGAEGASEASAVALKLAEGKATTATELLGKVALLVGSKTVNLETTVVEMKAKAGEFGKLTERVKALEAERTKARVDALIDEQFEAGKLLPDDEKAVAAFRDLAEHDEDKFKAIVASMAPVAEPGQTTGGRTSGGHTNRSRIIATAGKEYDQGKAECGASTSKANWVRAALNCEPGEDDLSPAELKEIGV